jgi:hypothetical protein
MFRYDAPNPYQVKSYFSSFISHVAYSKVVGNLVLPGPGYNSEPINESTFKNFSKSFNVIIQAGHVGTHDGATLETVQITPFPLTNQANDKQHFIIKFNGNGMCYDDLLREFANDANKLDVTVIGFDYRGVSNSTKTPNTFQDLVTDGIAQVQRLLDKGIDSTHINLDGISLGGGVATMVASYFHCIGQPVYLWNDRSFSSIAKTAANLALPDTNDICTKTLSLPIETMFWMVMLSVGWEDNIAKAYNSIPKEYKGYSYVAKKSDRSAGDGVIAHRASLHEGVKQYEKNKNMKTGHKFFAQSMFGGHNMSRNDLISTENQNLSAQDVFENFVRKNKR